MDAFLYFFTRLALWNIVLATMAFLFGLLMGHWMWGQFKSRLQKTGQDLLDTEANNATLEAELKEWRGKGNQTVEDKRREDQKHANELKAARDLAGDEKSKAQDIKRKLDAKEKEISKLTADLKSLQTQVNEPKEAAPANALEEQAATPEKGKKESRTTDKGERAYQKELAKLRSELSEEKRSKASLREVIAGLKGTQSTLQKKIQTLEKANQELRDELVDARKTH